MAWDRDDYYIYANAPRRGPENKVAQPHFPVFEAPPRPVFVPVLVSPYLAPRPAPRPAAAAIGNAAGPAPVPGAGPGPVVGAGPGGAGPGPGIAQAPDPRIGPPIAAPPEGKREAFDLPASDEKYRRAIPELERIRTPPPDYYDSQSVHDELPPKGEPPPYTDELAREYTAEQAAQNFKVDLKDLKNGFLLPNEQMQAVHDMARRHPGITMFRRYKDNQGNVRSDLTPEEKELKLDFSVIVGEDHRLYALYKGGEKALGHGHFATVKLGQELETGQWHAVKIQQIQHDQDIGQYEVETKALQAMCIGKTSLTRVESNKKYNVMTFKRGTSLFEYIQKPDVDIKEKLQIAILLTQSIRILHANHFLHRDIHLGNAIYNPQSQELALVDYGTSAEFSNENPIVSSSTLVGAINYQAPENLTEYKNNSAEKKFQYRAESDVYSLGQTFKDMFFGPEPLDSKIHRTELEDRIINLIEQMSKPNWNERPPIQSISNQLAQLIQIYIVQPSVPYSPPEDSLRM